MTVAVAWGRFAGFEQASAGSNLTKRINNATKELTKASHEVSLLEGRSVELQAGVNEVTHQLRDTKFTDIDDRVREEIIRFETTKLAVEDLEKYHLTLDKVRVGLCSACDVTPPPPPDVCGCGWLRGRHAAPRLRCACLTPPPSRYP